MLYEGDYEYFIKELEADEGQPYHMGNRELAEDLFKEFKKVNKEAGMYCYDISQFICKDNRAKKKLIEMLNKQKERQEKELKQTIDLIKEIEEEVKAAAKK